MTLSELIHALEADLDAIPMRYPDGEELERSEKLGNMYLEFPALAEQLWNIPPTNPVAIFEMQRRIVHEWRRQQLFQRLEGTFTKPDPKDAA